MKKQRWLSLVLILALVVGLCSVCAAAADDQTAEQPAQEAADTVAEAEAAPADGTQPDAAAAEANTETAEQPEQDAAAETDAAAEEAPADGTHIHAVNREDWTLDEPLCVAKNGVQVTLCLNGYSLSLADGAEGCIIYLAVSDEGAEPSVLTITDCNGAGTSSNYYVGEAGELIFDDGSFAWQEAYIAANEKNALAGGRITGATAGAISVGDYNQLYLSGVNIIDNEGRYGAGVVIAAHAKAVIDSCVIAGNRLTGEMKASERQILGGGVYCAGELELCGTTNLTGNRAQDAQNNLWLDETGTVTIGALGLDKQARVGVSGQAEQAVLTGYADDFSENFTSDDPTLCISAVHENGFTDLQLQEAVYTLTLVTDENDEPVTLEAAQGKSLADLYVNDPEREDAAFDGWYTEDEEPVDTQQPLHLTADTTLYAHWTQASDEEAAPLPDYDPDTPLTRQEAAKTLYQMAKQLGLDTEAGADVDLTQFTDADEIDADAEDAVRWAYASDLLTEKDGKLRVQEELSRKELSRMLEDLLALSSAD